MTAWFELPNYRLKKVYLASDAVAPMIVMADFKVGRLSNLIEKTWLFLIYAFFRKRFKASKPIEKIINSYKEAGFQNSLLYYTGWYKSTEYIGISQLNGQYYFTKYFKDIEKAIEQITNFEFVNKYFSGSFLLPKHERYKNIVFYRFITKSIASIEHQQILQRMLHCAENNARTYGILKSITSFIPDDMTYQMHRYNFHDVSAKLEVAKTVLSGQIVCAPIHGDFTPWNILIDTGSKVVLIDCERVGWHVYLYDCLHYLLQPLAFKGKGDVIFPLLKKYFPEQSDEILLKCSCLYLIDQIYNDFHALEECNNSNKFLKNALSVKIVWLSSLLDKVNDAAAN